MATVPLGGRGRDGAGVAGVGVGVVGQQPKQPRGSGVQWGVLVSGVAVAVRNGSVVDIGESDHREREDERIGRGARPGEGDLSHAVVSTHLRALDGGAGCGGRGDLAVTQHRHRGQVRIGRGAGPGVGAQGHGAVCNDLHSTETRGGD